MADFADVRLTARPGNPAAHPAPGSETATGGIFFNPTGTNMTTPPMHPALGQSECAADILDVLAAAERRLSTREIFDAVNATRLRHSWTTLKTTLSLMVRLDMLDSRRTKPWGYVIRPAVSVPAAFPRIA